MLLDHGADVNLVSRNGTALGVAAFQKNPEMLHLLIKRGTDTNIIGGDDGTVLARARDPSIIRILLDNGANIKFPGARQSPLGQAAFETAADLAQFIFDNGANVNYVDREVGSALVSGVLGCNRLFPFECEIDRLAYQRTSKLCKYSLTT